MIWRYCWGGRCTSWDVRCPTLCPSCVFRSAVAVWIAAVGVWNMERSRTSPGWGPGIYCTELQRADDSWLCGWTCARLYRIDRTWLRKSSGRGPLTHVILLCLSVYSIHAPPRGPAGRRASTPSPPCLHILIPLMPSLFQLKVPIAAFSSGLALIQSRVSSRSAFAGARNRALPCNSIHTSPLTEFLNAQTDIR